MNFLFVLFFALLLSSCSQETSQVTHFSGTAMTIDFKITIGTPLSEKEQVQVKKVILDTFDEVDRVFNRWNPSSELAQLNRLPADTVITLSPALEQFLHFTEEMVHLSGGRFDPTIEPLQVLWKNALCAGKVPTPTEIAAVAPGIGWSKIHFGKGTFSKEHALTSLDLGGIAKGYCVDLLVERLVRFGHSSVFVEWGGEIRAQGEHPDKRPWTIYISNLEDTDPAHALATVSLYNSAIATSGDYLQYWIVNNTRYFHIFNPQSLQPLTSSSSSIASASIEAPTCALADALATTALMFSTPEEAEIWLAEVQKKHPSVRMWLKIR